MFDIRIDSTDLTCSCDSRYSRITAGRIPLMPPPSMLRTVINSWWLGGRGNWRENEVFSIDSIWCMVWEKKVELNNLFMMRLGTMIRYTYIGIHIAEWIDEIWNLKFCNLVRRWPMLNLWRLSQSHATWHSRFHWKLDWCFQLAVVV